MPFLVPDGAIGTPPLEWAIVGSGMRPGHDPHPDRPANVGALPDAGTSTGGIVLSPNNPNRPAPKSPPCRARGIPEEASTTTGD
jgi:hypothetical protein